MFTPFTITSLVFLSALAIIVIYYDVRYRRIPNAFVLSTLVSGLIINSIFGGFNGALSSLAGCALALGLMLVPHILGALGAGDVKLFAAIGSLVGLKLVIPTFIIVVLAGGALAIYTMLRNGTVRHTMHGVLRIFVGLLPGWQMPRFGTPADLRHTIPYGVAIMLGTIISLVTARA
jgi:prepilin peptidase CpaA